jgi:DNA-binding HxlR family transcriptional regulator
MPNPQSHMPQSPVPQSRAKCPMDSLLRLLMGPWTTYILWVLHSDGPTRFGALKRRVAGISAKMLTERLRMLEDAGVVLRHHQPSVPPQVTYSLTERGQELRQVLNELSSLAQRWQAADVLATVGEEAAGPAATLEPVAAAAGAAPPDSGRLEATRQAAQPPADVRPAESTADAGPAEARRRYVSAAE